MKRFDSDDKDDAELVKILKIQDWMLNCLLLNPDYNGWSPGDDYMKGVSKDAFAGWDSAIKVDTWKESNITANDLNIIANFFFNITYDSHDCPECDGMSSEENGTVCEKCHEGAIYTSGPRLSLVLWVLHPRKGASRGWTIKQIEQHELKEVYAFLHKAAEENEQRFSRIPKS